MKKIITFLIDILFKKHDVQTALNFSLGKQKPSFLERVKYDVNTDGKINVQDVKLIMNKGGADNENNK